MINLGNGITNNWLYKTEECCVLVDTGYPESFSLFKRNLAKHGLTAADIKYVFVTHAHDDHVGFLKNIMDINPEIKVIIGDKALSVLQSGQNPPECGCTGTAGKISAAMLKLTGKAEHRFSPLYGQQKKRCIVVTPETISDAQRLLHGEILKTPGHTAGSLSLLLGDGSLFCGDAAMNGFPCVHNISLVAQNAEEYTRSWDVLLNTTASLIYPGHGKPFSPARLRRNRKYAAQIKITHDRP